MAINLWLCSSIRRLYSTISRYSSSSRLLSFNSSWDRRNRSWDRSSAWACSALMPPFGSCFGSDTAMSSSNLVLSDFGCIPRVLPVNNLNKLRHQDRLARFSDERETLFEKLTRLPIEDLLYLRDELERIRVQEQRSKFKLIKGGRDLQRAS